MPKPHHRESESSIDSSPLQKSGLDCRLSRKQRLTRPPLFSETFGQNRKWVGRYMVLWLRHGEGASKRLGVVTSKKVHLRANRRNFARRRLREAYRNLRPYFSGDFDVIFVGRRAILSADWKDVLGEMAQLARKAGIISDDNLEKTKLEFQLGHENPRH